jgi:intein/homing endonuclease
MEFTKQDLEKFIDSGKEVCIYSKEIVKLLRKYSPKDFLKFSNRSYYYWIKENRPVPISVVLNIMTKSLINKLDVTSLSVGSGNKITFRKEDYYLSYFLGLLLGDGCLVHRKRGHKQNLYHAQISFATEQESKFGMQLVRYLFNIKSSIYFGRGCYNLCIYSKPLVIFLNVFYQIPIGEKYSKLTVPEIISLSSNKSISYFLKGVFDSDGNIYSYRKGKSVQLRQKSKFFLDELHYLFCKLGLNFNKPYYDTANNSWVLWSSKKALVDNFINKIIALKLVMPG